MDAWTCIAWVVVAVLICSLAEPIFFRYWRGGSGRLHKALDSDLKSIVIAGCSSDLNVANKLAINLAELYPRNELILIGDNRELLSVLKNQVNQARRKNGCTRTGSVITFKYDFDSIQGTHGLGSRELANMLSNKDIGLVINNTVNAHLGALGPMRTPYEAPLLVTRFLTRWCLPRMLQLGSGIIVHIAPFDLQAAYERGDEFSSGLKKFVKELQKEVGRFKVDIQCWEPRRRAVGLSRRQMTWWLLSRCQTEQFASRALTCLTHTTRRRIYCPTWLPADLVMSLTYLLRSTLSRLHAYLIPTKGAAPNKQTHISGRETNSAGNSAGNSRGNSRGNEHDVVFLKNHHPSTGSSPISPGSESSRDSPGSESSRDSPGPESSRDSKAWRTTFAQDIPQLETSVGKLNVSKVDVGKVDVGKVNV